MKCKVLHLGRNNPMHSYLIIENGVYQDTNNSICEKDLGKLIDPIFNFNEHKINITNKGR